MVVSSINDLMELCVCEKTCPALELATCRVDEKRRIETKGRSDGLRDKKEAKWSREREWCCLSVYLSFSLSGLETVERVVSGVYERDPVM